MLPKHLATLKERLERKTYSNRSPGEDKLLEELDLLDKDPDVLKRVEKGITEGRMEKYGGIVGGPVDFCHCCQRPM